MTFPGYDRIRSTRFSSVAIIFALVTYLQVIPAFAFPFETNKFVAVNFDDLPERVKLYTKDYKGKLAFKVATISGAFGSFVAIRIISDECADDFCRTYFQFSGRNDSYFLSSCSEWLRLYTDNGASGVEIQTRAARLFVNFTLAGPDLEVRKGDGNGPR
jgi:hypothetical protein